MARLVLTLLLMAAILNGCFDQVVVITSTPTDAAIYSNRVRLGNTPMITSKDEIMPLWDYYLTFSRAVIVIRKPGYEDYLLSVDELTLPGSIQANLVPIPAQKNRDDSNTVDPKMSIENR